MAAHHLLRNARAAGLTIADEAGQLVVRGPLRLAAAAEAVLAQEDEVLTALRAEAATITLADALDTFPGARIVGSRPVPPGLRCARCGTSSWRPAAQVEWF